MLLDLTGGGNCPINGLFTDFLRVGLDHKMKTLRKEGISFWKMQPRVHDISACSFLEHAEREYQR